MNIFDHFAIVSVYNQAYPRRNEFNTFSRIYTLRSSRFPEALAFTFYIASLMNHSGPDAYQVACSGCY